MVIKPLITLATPLLFTIVPLSAGDAFTEATNHASSGKYPEAVTAYEAIIAAEGTSAALEENLGRCHIALEQPGPAVLHLRRALLLAPRDSSIHEALKEARAISGLTEIQELIPFPQRIAATASAHEWSVLLIAGLIIITIAAWAACFSKQRSHKTTSIIFIAISLTISALSAWMLQLKSSDSTRAIVMSNTPLLLSPFPQAESLTTCEAGREVIILRSNPTHTYTALPSSDQKGWIETASLTKITL